VDRADPERTPPSRARGPGTPAGAALSVRRLSMHRLAIEAEERAGILVGLQVRGVDLERELRAIRRRLPAPSSAARAFWGWLAAHTG
jgi:hypothetical protein